MFSSAFLCLLAGLCKNCSTDFHKIRRKCRNTDMYNLTVYEIIEKFFKYNARRQTGVLRKNLDRLHTVWPNSDGSGVDAAA